MAKAKKPKITELELLRAILEKLEQIRQEIAAMRLGRPVYYVAPRPAPARPPEWAPKVKTKPTFKPITKIAKAKRK